MCKSIAREKRISERDEGKERARWEEREPQCVLCCDTMEDEAQSIKKVSCIPPRVSDAWTMMSPSLCGSMTGFEAGTTHTCR